MEDLSLYDTTILVGNCGKECIGAARQICRLCTNIDIIY